MFFSKKLNQFSLFFTNTPKSFLYLSTFIILFVLPFTLYLISNATNYLGIASSSDTLRIEAEGFSISGPAQLGSDPSASGGQYILLNASGSSSSGIAPMPLISRGVPAFASSAQNPASSANDADYGTRWVSSGPGWLAYNLSSVTAAQRGKVLVAWYNDPITSPYDHSAIGDVAYNIPGNYTIEGNPAPSGGSAPTTGWTILATVTNNKYHSRQHAVDLTGDNWVRINVTAIDGSPGNTDVAINMDVHDASAGPNDSWIFLGDSITQDGMFHTPVGGANNYSQLINATKSNYYPAYEDGGIGGTATANGAASINTWLSTFPGKYVSLAFGTNNDCNNTTAFYNDYKTMVTAILNAGKVPIVPTFPHSTSLNTACFQQLINQLNNLYNDPTIINGKTMGSQIIKGPDFWNTPMGFRDGLHPNDAGYATMRQLWASTMIAAVYNSTTTPTPTSAAGTPTPTSILTNTPTATPAPATPTPTSSGPTPTPGGHPTFSALHVSSGKIWNTQNQAVHLHGVNHSGTEYACIVGWGLFDTPDGNPPDVNAMKSWNINAVNIPINEDCWLGINGVMAAYGGVNYQNAIQNFVNLLLTNNIYPVITMFWTAPGTTQALDHNTMSNMDHTPAAWTSIANKFKGDNRIMFRLLQEPHPSAGDSNNGWNCWYQWV
jgi:lysophospholipase L1-like esterase